MDPSCPHVLLDVNDWNFFRRNPYFYPKHFVLLERPSLSKSGGFQQCLMATYSIILGPAEAFGIRDEMISQETSGIVSI